MFGQVKRTLKFRWMTSFAEFKVDWAFLQEILIRILGMMTRSSLKSRSLANGPTDQRHSKHFKPSCMNWKSISPITPILQSQTSKSNSTTQSTTKPNYQHFTVSITSSLPPFPWILTAPCWHPSSFEIFPKLVDFFRPSSVLHSPLCLNLRLGAPDKTTKTTRPKGVLFTLHKSNHKH